MEEIIILNNLVDWRGKKYYFHSIEKIDEQCVHITMSLTDNINLSNQTFAFICHQTVINGQIKNTSDEIISLLIS